MIALFQQYDWPGNIRELRNTVERMVVLEDGNSLGLHGAKFLLEKIKKRIILGDVPTNKQNLKSKEKEQILSTLEQFSYNKTLTAQSLGIDRSTLWRKMKKYNL